MKICFNILRVACLASILVMAVACEAGMFDSEILPDVVGPSDPGDTSPSKNIPIKRKRPADLKELRPRVGMITAPSYRVDDEVHIGLFASDRASVGIEQYSEDEAWREPESGEE